MPNDGMTLSSSTSPAATSPSPSSAQRVAVIGSGLAGLSAAWLLSRAGVQVTLYERQSELGLGAASFRVRAADASGASVERDFPVDVPPRYFASGYYRELLALYEHIGVHFGNTDASATFSWIDEPIELGEQHEQHEQHERRERRAGGDDNDDDNERSKKHASSSSSSSSPSSSPSSSSFASPASATSTLSTISRSLYFSFNNVLLGFGRKSIPYLGLSTFRSTAWFFIVRDLYCLKREGTRDYLAGRMHACTIDDYLRSRRYSFEFREQFLYPTFCVVCTCSTDAVRRYPAADIFEYFTCMCVSGSSLKRAAHGTKSIVAMLAANVHRVVTNANVTRVRPVATDKNDGNDERATASGVVIESDDEAPQCYDHVVMATQALQALDLLGLPRHDGGECVRATDHHNSRADDATPLRLGSASVKLGALPHTTKAQSPSPSPSPSPSLSHVAAATCAPSKPRPSDAALLASSARTLALDAHVVDALRSFRYEEADVIVHTDARLMPTARSDWRPLNIFIDRGHGASARGSRQCMVTAWQPKMIPVGRNLLAPHERMRDDTAIFQTWNPIVAADPRRVMKKKRFQRPVVTLQTRDALDTLHAAQGTQRVHFCGAYSSYGIPLLEQAASSGLRVAERIAGTQRPWRARSMREELEKEDKNFFSFFVVVAVLVVAVPLLAVLYSSWSS